MMAWFVLAILLAVVAAVSVVLDRRWQAGHPAEAVTSETEDVVDVPAPFTSRMTSTLRDGAQSLRDRITRRRPSELPQQFRTWIAAVSAADTSVKNWLGALSDEGLQAFTDHLAEFCSDMGFELSWLVGQQLDKQPELAQAATKIVLHYCRACHQAVLAQDDLKVYKTLLQFEQHPSSKANQAFGQKLFARLVEAGLTAISISEHLATAPKKQQQQMVQTIREAAEQHREAFNRILKEVMGSAESAAQSSTSTSDGQDPATSAAPV